MHKFICLGAGLCLLGSIVAQTKPGSNIRKNDFTDSTAAASQAADMMYELPVISAGENEKGEQAIPSVLYAGRDILLGMAGFHFSMARFRLRGYDASFSETRINGILMNSMDDGNPQWSLWGGLNDVTRNAQTSFGLRNTEIGFGSLGTQTSIDMRASKQFVQNQFVYAFSNRNTTHKWAFTKNTGMGKKGWAFVLSGSIRSAAAGYFPGTGYRGVSYYAGIDKRLGMDGLLSMVFFGSLSENARQAAVTEEPNRLANTQSYNPYWGYQLGRKRNANLAVSHQPVLILSYERRINNYTSWLSSLACITGEKYTTALDWYHAADPRPDYYRYLPSYQKDSLSQKMLTALWENEEKTRQINWERMYDVNAHSYEAITDANGNSGQIVSGLRSHYILSERVVKLKRIDFNTVYTGSLSAGLIFNGGASVQIQQSRYFQRVRDLLGGDYYVDRNQFAESDSYANPDIIQNDLNHPDRILYAGDKYGYDYAVQTQKIQGWLQLSRTGNKADYFAAVSAGYTFYMREGFMRNGLFPEHSFGRSEPNEFLYAGMKAGVVYKINGRKYLYLHAALLARPPLFDDVYISPRSRDFTQETIAVEKTGSVEWGYIWNAPVIKARVSGYISWFRNGMNVTGFYHDGYGSFVNNALSGMNKVHAGIELGLEYKLSPRFSFTAAVSAGRYYESSRSVMAIIADNNGAVLEKAQVYSKNFRVAGTPQEVLGLGIKYQSTRSFFFELSSSFFREQWLSYNPLRRTYGALGNIQPDSDQWKKIIAQYQLPAQSSVDLSAGGSVRTRLFGSAKKKLILFFLGINNLLNNRSFISGGFEQLRFDPDSKNPDKFPPKFYYAMGLNFSFNTTIRLS